MGKVIKANFTKQQEEEQAIREITDGLSEIMDEIEAWDKSDPFWGSGYLLAVALLIWLAFIGYRTFM